MTAPNVDAYVMFQSTPAITGERAANQLQAGVGVPRFQSTPAITGERAYIQASITWVMCGFNPRPPLLASEPLISSLVAATTTVSIHARHYWRASPPDGWRHKRCDSVSIHARHYWRASHSSPGSGSGGAGGVSIHARHYWRASQG